MSDLNTQILIGADATGVEAGVGKAKRSLKDLGDSAKRSGKDAAEGLSGVGAGAEKSARQIAATTRSIERDLQKQIAAYQAGSTSSRQYQETMARFRGADVNALKPWLDQLDAAKRKSEDLAQANTKLGGSFDGLRAAASVTARALGALGIGLSVNELIKMADASTNIASRLTLVTSSSVELARVQKDLFQIAQASRVSFVDLVGTYAQVARSTKDLGISQTALLGVINTISQAVTISGGSAASAQAALTQLSQGFASGALRGEELNSILEQTPRLAQAIADGLGVTVGKLREMGQAGELTANAVLGALERSAAGVAAEFGKMATTVEQASTQATNSVLRLVGAFDKLSGATSFVSSFITKLSQGIDFLSKDVEKLGSQGPLRAAADEVLELDRRATILRNGLRNGFYGPKFQKELDDVNAKLAEAKRRFNELDAAMGGPNPRDQSGFTPRSTSYANEASRQKQLREDGNKFLLKQSGVPDGYVKDMNELIRLNQEGVIVGDAYTAALKKQQEVLLQKTGVTKGVAAAINEEQNAYESLIASIRAKVDEDKLELQGGQNLTESQRMRIKLDQDLRTGRVKLNGAHEASIRAAIAEKEVTEQALKIYKEALKLSQDRQVARNKETDSIEAWTKAQEAAADQTEKSIAARISSLESEEEAVALARETNISLAEAIERVAIARLREKRDGPTGSYENSPEYNRLTAEIELRERLARGIGTKEMREESDEAMKRSAKKAQDELDRYIEDTQRGLGDAIETAIFDGSKAGGEKMREVLQEALLRKPLRMVIDGVLNQVTGGVLQLLGVGGGGGAAGGSSPLGSLFSLGSSAYQGYTGLTSGQGILGSIGNAVGLGGGGAGLAASNAASAANGLSALQATNVGSFGGVGSGVIGQGGAYSAAGAGTGSLAAGGIAAIIMLGVINALGGMRTETMVGSGLAGTLGNGSALTPWQEWREGGTLFDGSSFATHNPLEELSQRKAELQRLRDSGQGESNYAVGIQAVVTDLEKTTKGLAEQTEVFTREIGKGYKAYRTNVVDMADSLGLAGDSVKDFAYTLGAQDLNFQGLNPEQIQAKIAETFGKAGVDMAQQLLGTWKEVTDTVVNTYATEQMTQASDGAFQTDTTVTRRMEYQASVYAKTGETAIQTLTRLSTSFNALNETADALGFGIQKGSLALADFSDKFIEAFGGLEKFSSTTSAYMQAYYSDEERRQALLRSGARQANRLGLDGVTAESLEQLGRDGIRAFVTGLTEGGGSPEEIRDAMDLANFLAPAFASVEAQTPVVQELSNVVDELTQSYQNAVKSLTGDRDKLAVDKLRAQGDEAGAKSLERQQYLDSFVNEAGVKLDEGRLKEISTLYDLNQATREHISVLSERNSLQDEINALTDTSAQALARQRDALDESNRALFDNLQAIKLQQAIAAELPGVANMYLTPDRQVAAGYDRIAADFVAEGFAGVTGKALAALSKDELAGLLTTIYNLGSTTDNTRLMLIRAAGALSELKDQAIGVDAASTDAAYAALEREAGLRRKVLDESIADVRAVFDAVSDAARSLYGDVASTSQMLASQGRSFIENALSNARLTGYMPDSKELQKAISAATSGISKQVYATQFDADRDRLVLAGQLAELGDISGDQLSEQEKQIKALDGILESNREQIDAMRGIDTRVLGVDARIAMLTEAILKEGTTRGGASRGGGGARPDAPGSTTGSVLYGANGAMYDATQDMGYQSGTGAVWMGASIRDAAREIAAAGDAKYIYDYIKTEGYTLAQANTILGMAPGSAEQWAKDMGLPIYHAGTSYVPQTGPALLQQGEAVIPAAFNPFNGANAQVNTARMEVLMEQLIDDNRRQAGEIIRLSAQLNKIALKWDDEGVPEEREA